jgi:DNA-binding transcriptional ArsR family regulator
MSKVTLDMNTFKALASDTRLDILRTLDGKKMSLKDISSATSLNKATLHEHLTRLHEAGLVKRKERQGHKWVYYKLSWKGECLLHPENTRIVILFSTTFFCLFFGVINLLNYAKGRIVGIASTFPGTNTTGIYAVEETGNILADSYSLSFDSLRNVANVPIQNQTIVTLSNALNENATSQGVWQIDRACSELRWRAAEESDEIISKCAEYGSNITEFFKMGSSPLPKGADIDAAEGASSVFGMSTGAPDIMVAISQDPILLYIAIGCIIACTVLLSVGIWRLWKNKTPKL